MFLEYFWKLQRRNQTQQQTKHKTNNNKTTKNKVRMCFVVLSISVVPRHSVRSSFLNNGKPYNDKANPCKSDSFWNLKDSRNKGNRKLEKEAKTDPILPDIRNANDNQESFVWDHPGKSGKGRQTGLDTSGHQKCLFLESLRFQEQWKDLQHQIKSSQI